MNQITKLIVFTALSASLFLTLGCKRPSFINLTSTNISQNPSGIYTLQTEVDLQDRKIKSDSIEVLLVVGGESYPMVKDPINPALWSCDYKLPSGFDEATYYFQANYISQRDNGSDVERSLKSDLQVFRLENRYVGNLAAYRGPVGVEIAVQGRGLTKYDAITIGGEKTATRYLSENELRFTIPALPSGVDYPVQLIGGPHGALDIGNFRIDESILSVVPNTLEIQAGDTATLLFKIDFEAPQGGLPIDIKTNVPASVIMPEAFINQGDKTVNVPVRGGEPGEGKLIVSASGYEPVEIPVKVF
ncbi:MAG: IPT/TIG domain-containing protein [Verrucomicrobiota bacterium]|nr:IPT/TIG domain-containing protein [Verrucomicrobiota bacterium]